MSRAFFFGAGRFSFFCPAMPQKPDPNALSFPAVPADALERSALVGFSFRWVRLTPQPVALAGDLDEFGVLENSVEDGGSGRLAANRASLSMAMMPRQSLFRAQ